MITDININKPEPIALKENYELFYHDTDVNITIKILESGKPVLIKEVYSNGLLLLRALKIYLSKKLPNKSFQEQQEYRKVYHKLSNLILIKIAENKISINKAPFIGWLEKFYPNSGEFLLSFPQVQELNSSWQWYKKGVSIPVLRNKIHPYYGTYFPTRFDHFKLIDNWLKRYEGDKKTAIEVGFGSGVLSLQLVKYGFQKVFSTETNPNAIVGLTEFMGDTKISRKIELDFAPLFGKFEKQTELIVFNPPWLPESDNQDTNDETNYYDKNLFSDFFAGAKQRLLPDGKLLLLFSNLAQIANLTKEHPIEKELATGGRFKLERCFKKLVKTSSDKTMQNQNWRSSEQVELWVLTNR